MAKSKTKIAIAILLTILIVATVINVYQYTQNVHLILQKSDMEKQLSESVAKVEMSSILVQVQMEVTAQLELIDEAILSACAELSTMDLMGEQARAVMSDLAASNPYIVNAATADANDTLLVVAPGEYRSIEAINICYQEQNIKMHSEMRPAMSSIIHLVEGFYGVVMVAPIFDVNNTFIGSLSIVIQPSEIINAAVAPAIRGTPFSMWAMQLNGTLLYDPDPNQQGKNLFTDPIYSDFPTVQTFTQQIANAQSGYGTYTYHQDTTEGEIVSKEAYWTTTGIYGAEWRIVILNVLSS